MNDYYIVLTVLFGAAACGFNCARIWRGTNASTAAALSAVGLMLLAVIGCVLAGVLIFANILGDVPQFSDLVRGTILAIWLVVISLNAGWYTWRLWQNRPCSSLDSALNALFMLVSAAAAFTCMGTLVIMARQYLGL